MILEVNSLRYVASAEEMDDNITTFCVEDRRGESKWWSWEGQIVHAYVTICYLKRLHRMARVGIDVVQDFVDVGPRKFFDDQCISCRAVRVR